jgi:hypothetical protein
MILSETIWQVYKVVDLGTVLEEESLISPKTLSESWCCFNGANFKPIFWDFNAGTVHGVYCVQESISIDLGSSSWNKLVIESTGVICRCQRRISYKFELEREMWIVRLVSVLIILCKTEISIYENECCSLVEPSSNTCGTTFTRGGLRSVKHVASCTIRSCNFTCMLIKIVKLRKMSK